MATNSNVPAHLWLGFGAVEAAKKAAATTTANQNDNSSPLGKGIPKLIGTSAFTGAIIIDPDKLGGVRLVNGKQVVSLVLGFLDADLGGAADLVWLKANDQFIFRASTPKRAAPSPMRVYGGDQVALDPLILSKLTATEATFWPDLVYIVLEDFDITPYSESPEIPVFRAAWSTNATAIVADEVDTTLTFGDVDPDYSQGSIAYDYQRNIAYHQLWNADNQVIITTVDLATLTEINRVTLPTSMDYGYFNQFTALIGTDLAVVQCYTQYDAGDIGGLRLINCKTGAVVYTLNAINAGGYFEPGLWGAYRLTSGAATKYLLICNAAGGSFGTMFGNSLTQLVLADATNGTLTYLNHPARVPIRADSTEANLQSFAVKSVIDGVLTGFFTEDEGSNTVWKLVAGTSGMISCTAAYTNIVSGKRPIGVGYDPLTDSLIISREDESTISVKLSTGAVNWTVDISVLNEPRLGVTDNQPQSPVRPGYGVFYDIFHRNYLMDFSDGSYVQLSTNAGGVDMWVNQYTGQVFYEGFDSIGPIHVETLGDLTPNEVDAADILTALATYQGDYDAGDLTFENFTGGECLGYSVDSDTTIDDCIRDVCTTLGIRETHDNGKIRFSMPLRDASFALDKTLTNADLTIDLIEQQISDEDASLASCQLTYIDPDANFEQVAQTYARPTGAYSVTRSNRKGDFQTSLVMTAPQAARAAWRMTYESEHDRTSYTLGVGPNRLELEPGDGIQFPFGIEDANTIVGEIREAQINPDFSQSLTVTQYMQTSESIFAGTGLVTTAPVNVSAYTSLTVLDLPLLRTSDDLAGAGLRSYALISGAGTNDIPSSTLWQSGDGVTFTAQASKSGIAPITGAVSAFSGLGTTPFAIDYVNDMDVVISTGDIDTMVSTDAAGLVSLTNLAAIGQHSRWVLVSFQDVAVSGVTATLSTLLWGVGGTEVYISQLVAGDQFIMLKPSEVISLAAGVADLNDVIYLKAGYSGFLVSSLGTVLASQDGEAEKPFAPVTMAYSDAGPTRTITWQFRERLGDLPVLYGTETAGYSETSLAFEIDLYNGSTFVVTLTAAAATVNYNTGTYTATKANIYQMSGLGIRGHGATLTF